MKFADAPRLPKLPFILGDIALLLLAAVIAYHHKDPLTPLPLLIITGCVVVGALASFIPFLINYARDQEEASAALRRELGEQFKRLMAASEHLQHSTVQLKTIEEIATKNLQVAEKLPYRLQEKIAEFNQQLAETENEEKEALEQELAALRAGESERLAAVTDKIAKTTAEWTKLEAEMRRQSADAAQLEQKLAKVLAAIEAKIAAFEAAVRTTDRTFIAPPPIAIPAPQPPAGEPSLAAAPAAPVPDAGPGPDTASVPAAVATEAPKPPRKPRAPRKPKLEEPAPAAPAPVSPPAKPAAAPTELIVEPVADEPPMPENFSQVPADEGKPAAAPSADGLTRLTVTSYIGIGNKLYLRGEGPGLNWDKGVPLQFISIGRWRWETAEASAPVTCKIYKNDKLEAPGGPLTLAPGTEQEVNAAF
jgi:hypothetical protein